ncbi:MAG: hypothetical protein M0P33_06195, partial [Massilibacteroides sp.]|nr:hypothetical protein [Massilibacteroides sp.]
LDYYMWKTVCLDGLYPEGKELPIVQAELIINGKKETYKISKKDSYVQIKKQLDKGIYNVQLNFLDQKGTILCGAYCGEAKIID